MSLSPLAQLASEVERECRRAGIRGGSFFVDPQSPCNNVVGTCTARYFGAPHGWCESVLRVLDRLRLHYGVAGGRECIYFWTGSALRAEAAYQGKELNYDEQRKGDGTRMWNEFQEQLAFRGYKLDDFPRGIPATLLARTWSKSTYSAVPSVMIRVARDAVIDLLKFLGYPEARCVCGEPITAEDYQHGNVAEVSRDDVHMLIHWDSCHLEGETHA